MKKKRKTGRQDYWRIGPFYIKKGVALMLLSAGALLVIGKFGLPTQLPLPEYDGEHKLYRYNDPDLREISDKVAIADSEGNTRYMGDVKKGVCTGTGRIYDSHSTIVYSGGMENNLYEGEGILYLPDGQELHAVFHRGQPQVPYEIHSYEEEGKIHQVTDEDEALKLELPPGAMNENPGAVPEPPDWLPEYMEQLMNLLEERMDAAEESDDS